MVVPSARQGNDVPVSPTGVPQVPKGSAEMVAAAIRTFFAQPDPEHVREQLDTIAGMLGRQFPKLETMLREAAPDITAFAEFPVPHWKKIWSTNPLSVNRPSQDTCLAAA